MWEASKLIRRFHPHFTNLTDRELAVAKISLEDALLIQALQHGYGSWAAFTQHLQAIDRGEEAEPFMAAFEAIQEGDAKTLRQLLDEEPWLATAQGSNGNSLLNLAVSFKGHEACQMLLEAGASVNLGNNYGWTPLHQVAMGRDMALMSQLVNHGGDLTLSARGEGGTPIVQALFWGNATMANAIACRDITPRNLRVAAGLGRLDLVESCFDASKQFTSQARQAREFYRPHGEFPEWAPSDDPQEILDEAFTYACRNGRTQVLAVLLERGANIASNPYQGTGLIWASYTNALETVRWLVEHGADINQQATFGGRNHGIGVTALHLAVQQGSLDKVRFLVELGANLDIPDHLYNATPTGWAEFFGHTEMAEYLLSLPNAGVLNMAARGLTERLAALLEEQPGLAQGANPEARVLPLHRAVENKHLETAELLLQHGADQRRVMFNGKNAFNIAEELGDEAMIGLLNRFGK